MSFFEMFLPDWAKEAYSRLRAAEDGDVSALGSSARVLRLLSDELTAGVTPLGKALGQLVDALDNRKDPVWESVDPIQRQVLQGLVHQVWRLKQRGANAEAK